MIMTSIVRMMLVAALTGTVTASFAGDGDFRAALADPLAWLYADSKVEGVERLDEIDVPINGVIDVNVLLNGLKPGVPLAFSASIVNGEWYRMRDGTGCGPCR